MKNVPLKPLVPSVRCLLAPVRRLAQWDRQTRIQTHTHTHGTSTITLTAHVHRGLKMTLALYVWHWYYIIFGVLKACRTIPIQHPLYDAPLPGLNCHCCICWSDPRSFTLQHRHPVFFSQCLTALLVRKNPLPKCFLSLISIWTKSSNL